MNSPRLATKCVAHPQQLVAALLYILTFCVPVTLNLRPVDYRHFSQHSSSTDSCLSLLNYLHMGFLFRSRFLPSSAQLLTHGFLTPFQISAFQCLTIYTWVSWSVPDFCLSLPNFLHIFFSPFKISSFQCPITFLGIPLPTPKIQPFPALVNIGVCPCPRILFHYLDTLGFTFLFKIWASFRRLWLVR